MQSLDTKCRNMDIVFKKFVNRCKMSEKIIGGQIYESKNKFW